MPSTATDATLDDAFRALADAERRRLLLALVPDRGPERSIGYPDDLPSPDRGAEEAYRIRLHHAHLPMLEAAGFIEWRREDERVARGPDFETIRPLLERLDADAGRVGVHDGD